MPINPDHKKKRVGVTKETADRLIQELLSRATQVNDSPEFLYRVTRIEVFGSYLTPKTRLGDIDIAIEDEFKIADMAERHAALTKQSQEEDNPFSGLSWLFWPHEKVMRFLKNRHAAFSFHPYSDLELLQKEFQTPSRLIYPLQKGQT